LGKPDGNRPQRGPRLRFVNNVKIDFRETGWDGVDWIGLLHDRDRWRAFVVMNIRVP
jgi:hypothetical protein